VGKVIKALVIACCLNWLPVVHAEEVPADKPVQTEVSPAATHTDEKKTKKGGVSTFWIVFIVSILFVLSSATALNTMGKKPPPRGSDKTPPRKKSDNGKNRFRL